MDTLFLQIIFIIIIGVISNLLQIAKQKLCKFLQFV